MQYPTVLIAQPALFIQAMDADARAADAARSGGAADQPPQPTPPPRDTVEMPTLDVHHGEGA